MNTLIRGFIVLILVIASADLVAQNQHPKLNEVLAKVAESVRHNNYRGRLTYEHSGKLEVLEIEHGVIDGIEYSRIDYLNGPDRKVMKNGRHATCVSHGTRLMSGGVIDMGDGAFASIDRAYSTKFLGTERVAGRDSWVIQLVPRDEHRHSFIVAVDQASYLPTKTLFVASGGKPLERLHFVSLDTDVDFYGSMSEVAEWGSSREIDPMCSDGEALNSGSRWQPAWVPPGFVLSHYGFSEQDGHMETYTDGLATFSVLAKPVDPRAEAAVMPANASYKKGATVVVMGLIRSNAPPVHVSVVGEIPDETAKRILSSVQAAKL